MSDYAFPLAALGVLILWFAWREYFAEKRRDATLMAACGTGGVLTAAAVWLA